MSHEIETGTINGIQSAAFFSAREHAWHTLGTVTEDAQDAQQAIKIAHLDWEVTKQPVYATVAGLTVPVPDKYATVRISPFTGQPEALGVVGKAYTVVQNWENADFLTALADESGAVFETAGSLRGGRQVFISMKLPEALQIGGHDAVDMYLVATNTHDGSSAFEVIATPIRVVCANTLRMATGSTKNKFRTRHTSGATGRIQEAREALDLTFKYADAFQAEAEALMAQAMTDAEFKAMLETTLLPLDKDATDRTKKDRDVKIDGMRYLFNEAPTQENCRGTRWAAYNAVAEYVDWAWPVKGNEFARAERVATSTATDRIEALKQQALLALR